jgi:hypothetical protein
VVWIQDDGAPFHCEECARQSLNESCRKVDWISSVDCMASTGPEFMSHRFFPIGSPEGERLWQDFEQLWQRQMPAC